MATHTLFPSIIPGAREDDEEDETEETGELEEADAEEELPKEPEGEVEPGDLVAVETPPFKPGDRTIDELEEDLADEGYDWNAAALRGLLEAEEEGEDRKGAKDLIRAALEETDA